MPRRGEPYWIEARVVLEILEPGGSSALTISIAKPFGLIGRTPEADVRFDDRSISTRHAYLHADSRGLFVVDLATRTGTRFDGKPAPCGWLLPGESIEIAGRFFRLAALEVDGHLVSPPPCGSNLLADSKDAPLCGLSLEPVGQRGVSWALGSELVFIGRGDSCGIRLNQANVARTHCALFRTTHGAYLIHLPGQPTLVNDQTPRGAIALNDGDAISIGQARFIARIAPPESLSRELVRMPSPHLINKSANLPSLSELGGLPSIDGRAFPIELIPPDSREAVIGWMLGTLHAGQSEILRRQDELQQSVAMILTHLQTDTTHRFDTQRDRIEGLAAELARIEANSKSTPSHSNQLHLPAGEPRRPARDLPPAPEIDPARSLETAAWLLERIDRVGHKNKFSLRSLLAGRGPRKSDTPQLDDPPSNPSSVTGSDSAGNDESA